ncbi:MAG TPA: L-histidine N(alpha)-methyltransferase [Capsulimonadaceae bacterium]|nr:L-histidine N(alpha)-methyltransferase [Capsulimonadaceae bacterium]
MSLEKVHAARAGLLADVLAGLADSQKTLPCKYFYDERGSQLFEEICDLDEYYPTRTETAIMCGSSNEMAALFAPGALLVEYGSGSSTKTRILLDHLPAISAYIPVDISREHLGASCKKLSEAYPHLEILPVCADYTDHFDLPDFGFKPNGVMAYFPGSTIGNFHPDEAVEFLTRIADLCGRGGGLLIGVDLKKDLATLELAYNDRSGVTAEFNLNLLRRINRETGSDFAIDQFHHHALYNPWQGRIEMHLVSRRDQKVRVGEREISFEAGESILTECSYKYTITQFAALAKKAGFQVKQVWTDPRAYFSVQYLTVARAEV